jgi:hypothetical protein
MPRMPQSHESFTVFTFSPINIPIRLKTGVNTHSSAYKNIRRQLDKIENVTASNGQEQHERAQDTLSQSQYRVIDTDVHQMQICTVTYDFDDFVVKYQIYPNEVAIVEVSFTSTTDVYLSSEDFDFWVLAEVARAIAATRHQMIETLSNAIKTIKSDLISIVDTEETQKDIETNHIYWTSKAILLDADQLNSNGVKLILERWLEGTENPDDIKLLGVKIKESMTWLNYVLIDAENDDERLEAMTLAQYCYIAHEKNNLALREAISNVYSNMHLKESRACLQESRISTRLHQVAVNEQIKYLTRRKRALLRAIFRNWDYDLLVKNGEDMIEICDAKIAEVDERQRTVNSKKTDRILFAISLFTIFELLIFLSQHSRDVMAHPALDYTDDSRSWVLSIIASLDADLVFGIGVLIMIVLGGIYILAAKEKL